MTYQEILFSSTPPIARVTLNMPRRINALSRRMISELTHVFHRIAADEEIKVVILGGAGNHFCAGHFLAEMVDAGVKAYKIIFDQCTKMMQLLHEIPQPVIGQVQGVATAAGCQLAAWCDLLIAEEGARFATPGVKIGLFCTTPMVAITRAIGRKAAMEMLLTGRYYPAREAKALGLVNHVVPLEDLAAKTEAMARQISEASAMVLGIGKQAFYAQVDQPDDKAMAYASHTIVMNNMAQDAQNGIKAFLNKTKPTWENR